MLPVTSWIAAWRQSFHARIGRGERGASLVEYALLVALISVVCIVAISVLGSNASTQFSNVGSAVS